LCHSRYWRRHSFCHSISNQGELMVSAIFTLDVGGKPILTFEAKNLRESWELCHEEWLRDDIARLKSDGIPLWDGAPLKSRYATEPEKAVFLEASSEPAPDDMLLAHLVELDAESI
jgi:hypothetical protein